MANRKLFSFEDFIQIVSEKHKLNQSDAELLLRQKLHQLKLRPSDITTYVNFKLNAFTQKQLGLLLQVSQSTISYRLLKFKKFDIEDSENPFLPDLMEMSSFNEQIHSNYRRKF